MTVQNYYQPRSVEEALALLARDGGALVMAGGTVTVPLINEGVSTPESVIGLRHAGLDYIKESGGSTLIGAATPLSRLLDLDALPLLQEAVRNTGAWAVRNMGTIGGNLFSPPPAGDVAVALLALDAQVVIARKGGTRVVPLSEFYTGFLSTVVGSQELVTEFQLPHQAGAGAYVKLGRKHGNTPAVVTVAARVLREGERVADARLALNAVGPHPFRAAGAEAILKGSTLDANTIEKAAEKAAEESQPFTDAIATEWYRRRMVKVMVRRALNQFIEKEG